MIYSSRSLVGGFLFAVLTLASLYLGKVKRRRGGEGWAGLVGKEREKKKRKQKEKEKKREKKERLKGKRSQGSTFFKILACIRLRTGREGEATNHRLLVSQRVHRALERGLSRGV